MSFASSNRRTMHLYTTFLHISNPASLVRLSLSPLLVLHHTEHHGDCSRIPRYSGQRKERSPDSQSQPARSSVGTLLFSFFSACHLLLKHSSSLLLHVLTQLPTEVIRMTQQPFHDVASQAIDFLYITKLLWTEADNFSRLETTVKEQVGNTLITAVREQGQDGFPHLMSLVGIFSERLFWIPVLWQWYLFGSRISSQCIEDHTLETHT